MLALFALSVYLLLLVSYAASSYQGNPSLTAHVKPPKEEPKRGTKTLNELKAENEKLRESVIVARQAFEDALSENIRLHAEDHARGPKLYELADFNQQVNRLRNVSGYLDPHLDICDRLFPSEKEKFEICTKRLPYLKHLLHLNEERNGTEAFNRSYRSLQDLYDEFTWLKSRVTGLGLERARLEQDTIEDSSSSRE